MCNEVSEGFMTPRDFPKKGSSYIETVGDNSKKQLCNP